MNRELERLVIAWEAVSASKDKEVPPNLAEFEALLDKVMERMPTVSRENLRKSVIKAHRKWALKHDNKPPAFPPRA